MPGIRVVRKTGPRSFVPAEAITGGQLVEARGSSRVGVAAAGSLVVLGVAIQDAITPEAFTSAPVSGVLNEAQNPTRVGLAYGGDEAPVTYAANTTFGQKLIAAAAGKVTPAGATPDARTIVGTCAEEAGVLANAVGLMRTI